MPRYGRVIVSEWLGSVTLMAGAVATKVASEHG